MNKDLKVSFDTPRDHWLAIYLDSADQHLELPFSYTPFDFPSELVAALLNLSDGFDAVARCSYNPEWYEFYFLARDQKARFEVVSHPDHRRVASLRQVIFSFEGVGSDICLAFWRGLRELWGRLSVAEYRQGFGRDFPEKELNLLTDRITATKQRS